MAQHNSDVCIRCNKGDHTIVQCPNVRSVDFDRDGNIVRVEFLVPTDFHRQAVDDVPAPDYPKLKPSTL